MPPTTITRSPIEKLHDDPWSLNAHERQALLAEMAPSQESWLRVLPDLVEPPAPTDAFPAFLLDTEPFGALRRAIGSATTAVDLDTATADELQRFVDRYPRLPDGRLTPTAHLAPGWASVAALPHWSSSCAGSVTGRSHTP